MEKQFEVQAKIVGWEGLHVCVLKLISPDNRGVTEAWLKLPSCMTGECKSVAVQLDLAVHCAAMGHPTLEVNGSHCMALC